jgi:hypothetical protein
MAGTMAAAEALFAKRSSEITLDRLAPDAADAKLPHKKP